MLRSNKNKQNEVEFITIEELVPENHFLRKVDQYIDFSFILEKVRIPFQLNTFSKINFMKFCFSELL